MRREFTADDVVAQAVALGYVTGSKGMVALLAYAVARGARSPRDVVRAHHRALADGLDFRRST